MSESRFERIDVHFPPSAKELYDYILARAIGWGDKSQVMREAAEMHRLFGTLEQAQEAKRMSTVLNDLESIADDIALQFITNHTKWEVDGDNHKTLVKLIINTITKRIEAGKEIAK